MARSVAKLLDSSVPLVAAPMSGGPTTTRLASAVTEAGAFAFLAGGYKTADALAAEMAELRAADLAFGVNLFAPNVVPITADAFRRYAELLRPEGTRFGLDLSDAVLTEDDDAWQDKLDLLLADPVPVVSVTFGLMRLSEVKALHRAGSLVLVTVTTVAEARSAKEIGADGVVAQGSEAGGHSGTHDASRPITAMPIAELTRAVIEATSLPVVAAGGVAGPDDVTDLLAAGAVSVAIGTLLLRTEESGASRTHKFALADPEFTETTITRSFTGRPARGLRNDFINTYEAAAPLGYPAIHHLTRPIRRAAAAAGDPHRLHLWAGTGFRHAPTGPAGAVIDRLAVAI